MPEEALQAAFEIKTACDEISRRLLRWHGAVRQHGAADRSAGANGFQRPVNEGKTSIVAKFVIQTATSFSIRALAIQAAR